MYDLKSDFNVRDAIELIKVGALIEARAGLLNAYSKACLYGFPSTRIRLIRAIYLLTTWIESRYKNNFDSGEWDNHLMAKRIVRLLGIEDADDY